MAPRSALARAALALDLMGEGYLLLASEGGFLEINREIVSERRARLALSTRGTRAATAEERGEDILESTRSAEYVGEIPVDIRVVASGPALEVVHATEAELVIRLPLLGIGEDLVRLARFLESLLRVLVIGMGIGMISQGDLPICLLYLFLCSRLGHAKNLVIISFSHTSPSYGRKQHAAMLLSVLSRRALFDFFEVRVHRSGIIAAGR